MRVLITGGAGYIGSHAVRALLDRKFEVSVADDLSHGYRKAVDARAEFFEIGVDDPELEKILKSRQIDAILHFAAFIEVGESVANPTKYYLNNFAKPMKMLESVHRAGIKKFVFSSTAAVYGDPLRTPIDEDHPKNPINPYGRSKWMMETALADAAAAFGLGYTSLRYFNVAGASSDSKIGEAHEPETHLIPRVLAAAKDSSQSVKIFGTDYTTPDGTCIRDYIHVEDLIDAHILALEKTKAAEGKAYNLGSEKGFSVREVIRACEQVTGKSIRAEESDRRAGDPAVLVASSEKIRTELGWKRKKPELEKIVRDAWNWMKLEPKDFRKN